VVEDREEACFPCPFAAQVAGHAKYDTANDLGHELLAAGPGDSHGPAAEHRDGALLSRSDHEFDEA
jgi:hypothetical protein